jgi:proline iminopeptidase
MQQLVDRFGGDFHRRPGMVGAGLSAIQGGYTAPWGTATIIRANDATSTAGPADS